VSTQGADAASPGWRAEASFNQGLAFPAVRIADAGRLVNRLSVLSRRDRVPAPQDNQSTDDRSDDAGTLVGAIEMDGAAKKGRDDTADDPENSRQHEATGIIR
jgi:hypothetical protein